MNPLLQQRRALTLTRCRWTMTCRPRSLSSFSRKRRSISRLSAIPLFRWKATTIRKRSTNWKKAAKQSASGTSTVKSVRIALARLDRMMNTVGELVINRTRMVGRVAELEKLVDTLSFSKERLQGKVAEFQEKYEFNRISNNRTAQGPWNPEPTPKMLTSAAAGDTSFWSEFSELEMDRYDDFNILSRSMAEISADVNEVLSQLAGFIGRVEGYIDEFTKLVNHL